MWYLESFDKETEFLVQEWRLPEVDDNVLRPLLALDDGDKEPLAPGNYNFKSLAAVRELAQRLDGPFEIDEACDYQVGYYAEPGEEGVPVNGLYPPPRTLPEAFEGFEPAKAKTPVSGEGDARLGQSPSP